MTADASPEGAQGDGAPAPSAPAKPAALSDDELKIQLETLLFITDHPLSVEELRKLTKIKDLARLRALVGELQRKLEDQASAVQILEIAGGFQMATRPAHAELVRKLFAERMTMRLSTAAHETLAIIAYKQPLTRAEIEDIRGVEVIAALETLLEKRLIKVVGRKESVGRPLLYGTTADFMRHFGLRSLEDLPPIDDFQAPDAPATPDAAAAPMTANASPEGGSVSADAIPEGAQDDGTTVPPQGESAAAPAASPAPPPADPIWPVDDAPEPEKSPEP
ncbi:MAG: SMC-Scp complex subunit ScpB [Elusimicrobia bacterium]|nr:SMC-Scp complex subunit ScpB [Elusimicrobiota bacterium]